MPAQGPQTFRCQWIDRHGNLANGLVRASDQRAVDRLMAAEGLKPVRIEAVGETAAGAAVLKPIERITALRALALMLGAGVDLLEAMEIAAGGASRPQAAAAMRAASNAMRGGQGFVAAIEAHVPGFPGYVLALARVGEATGRLSEVLADAAEIMDFEAKLGREVVNALIYPLFLLAAGCLAVTFMVSQVAPKFAVLIGENRATMPLISRLVLDAAESLNAHPAAALAAAAAMVLAGAAVAGQRGARATAYRLCRAAPVVGPVLAEREVATWARLKAFGLAHGVDLLQAAQLARGAAPAGAFRRGLEQYERDLRSGLAIDAALGRNTALASADLSLLRAGQRSGALAKMFAVVAEHHETRLRVSLKRMTVLIEPIAVGLISVMVGVIALSLMLALSSVYDRVQ